MVVAILSCFVGAGNYRRAFLLGTQIRTVAGSWSNQGALDRCAGSESR
jgi:hypothetical protein